MLVRDFRDMICSMFSFNKKRGYVGVGPQNAETDEDFVRLLRPRIGDLLAAYEERKDKAYLLHYEDLVLQPEDTLKRVLAYLKLDASKKTIDGMLKRASGEDTDLKTTAKRVLGKVLPDKIKQGKALSGKLQKHQTSGNAEASVGRWKRDLAPELQKVCDEALGDLIEKAGYEPTLS